MKPAGPVRVAVVSRAVYPIHGFGGLERHVHDLLRHLLARVTLITRPPVRGREGGLEPLVSTGLGVRVVPYRTFPLAGRRGTTILDRSTAYPLFGSRAGRSAADLVARGQLDIVHGLGAAALGYARQRLRNPRQTVPFVLNPQGLEEFGATNPDRARVKRLAYRPLQRAVRTSARAADCVIATDRVLVPWLLHHLAVTPDRVRVVPNAIALDTCDALAKASDPGRLRAAAGVPADRPVLLSAGRLEANKGFHVLVEALASLATRGGRPWHWVLAGDGPAAPRLRRLVAEHGLTGRTHLVGRVSDVELHGWYEAATVFVHPTLYEGSSLVTLEAMAHRRAVVATAAGGLPDKVRPGVNGWLVPPGDAAALVRAIGEAVASSDLAALGREGRAIVEREFSWTSAVDRQLEVYDELRSAAPAGRR
jgi:glycosyltransferase involved in cell wall biosynthesis